MSTATAVASVPFDLVDVKLAAPLTRPGTVAKESLIARLRTSDAPLATVVAPAGYGKTTLLSGWAEADARPFAWVALDGQDDDALVFMRYIAAAIHGIEPLPPAVFEALSGPGGSTWSTRLPRLGQALSGARAPAGAGARRSPRGRKPCLPGCRSRRSLDYVPAGSQIAIASREAPRLPVGRWRAQGRVQELGVADLRLDEREAGLLLEAAGVELDESALSELTERTEGWPAGLYLAALSFRAGAPDVAGAEGFAGEDRYVAEYFRVELLSRLPAAEAEFLMRTSVLIACLARSAMRCSRPRGRRTRSRRSLARNGFVVPLDRRGEWYRYHHLFGELLRDELERSRPDVVRALNRRAMEWCIANELPEAAVVYGHRAGELDTVAGLVDALALPLYYDGRMATVEEWLAWFGDDELRAVPRAGRLRSVVPRPHGPACRCRAVACARRRSNLGDPALGWQRDDRAAGRRPAGAHDAGRCRAGARGRRCGAGSALRRE